MHDDACENATVYLIAHTKTRRCYIGATVDMQHRLRQHNCKLAGGAKTTTRAIRTYGGTWELKAHVRGFETFRNALRFEWAFKRACRRKGWAVTGRISGLIDLLHRSRWTSNCPIAANFRLHVTFASDAYPSAVTCESLPMRITHSAHATADGDAATNVDAILVDSNLLDHAVTTIASASCVHVTPPPETDSRNPIA